MQPKYETTNEANQALYKMLNVLGIRLLNSFDFGYERHWDNDGAWISDNLTVYHQGEMKETTMSPEKFEKMSDEGKSDFIYYLMEHIWD